MESKKQIVWWKDIKLIVGMILIILNIILGIYGKVLIVAKFPVYVIPGLSIYALSWVLMFIGIFLVGRETFKIMQQRIQHHVKKTVRDTYHYTKQLPRKGYHYTKELHRKGIEKIKSISK